MKAILEHLIAHKTLDKPLAKQLLIDIANNKYNEYQVASFLTVFMLRAIRIEELEGFRDALLELCLAVDLAEFDPMDLCGTGGDGKNTFNISTLSSFIVAGAGIKVAKHGNYGVSSNCGSSNVLEYLGITFKTDESQLKSDLDKKGICFLHAPLFHPAMKNVAPIRKNLGIKTFFNMLGPMVNPAQPSKQLVGVFSLELARMYSYLYQQTDKQYGIVHALDGYDEVSLTGKAKLLARHSDLVLDASSFGVSKLKPEQIFGADDIKGSAAIFVDILQGNGTKAQEDVVCANAALAIKTYYPEMELLDAMALAQESLKGGKAKAVFNKITV
jgi:anthranilate phosphoribosyltransferase